MPPSQQSRFAEIGGGVRGVDSFFYRSFPEFCRTGTEPAVQACERMAYVGLAGTTAPDHFMLRRFYPNGPSFSRSAWYGAAGSGGASVGGEERGRRVWRSLRTIRKR